MRRGLNALPGDLALPGTPRIPSGAARRAVEHAWPEVLLGCGDAESVALTMWGAVEEECGDILPELRRWAPVLIDARRAQLDALRQEGRLPETPVEQAFAEVSAQGLRAVLVSDECGGVWEREPREPAECWRGSAMLPIREGLVRTGRGALDCGVNWPHFFDEAELGALGRKRRGRLEAQLLGEFAQLLGRALRKRGLGFEWDGNPKHAMRVSGVEVLVPLRAPRA